MSLLGQTAPDFTLINTAKEPVALSSLRGKKVILAFYPAAFSGICDKEMCTFQERLATLNDANAIVLGISPDSPFANAKFAEVHNLSFDLLSDLHLEAAKAYGVLFENFAFIDGYTACNRAVFVVDEQGVVTWSWAGAHPGMEPDYDAVMAAV
jgi:peroxiredoxin